MRLRRVCLRCDCNESSSCRATACRLNQRAGCCSLLSLHRVLDPMDAVGQSSGRTRAANARVEACHLSCAAAALVGVESSTPQQGSGSGCEHSAATSDSFTTNRLSPRHAVLSFRGRQAAAAPFCRCNAWPSATMLRLEARFFAPNVRCVWPCPWPGCRNETWPSALLRHTQQQEQTCRDKRKRQPARKEIMPSAQSTGCPHLTTVLRVDMSFEKLLFLSNISATPRNSRSAE